ncbi:MAG: hypothetical protein AAF696_30770, partial [Bacteroidota bacterium]
VNIRPGKVFIITFGLGLKMDFGMSYSSVWLKQKRNVYTKNIYAYETQITRHTIWIVIFNNQPHIFYRLC